MTHPAPEAFHDYFAAALEAAEAAALEEHVFGCQACARAFDAAGGLAAGLRALTPTVVSRAWLERAIGGGAAIRAIELAPGDRIDAEFSRGLAYLVLALRADLAAAARVDLEVLGPDGAALARMEAVPFDPARGEVLIACQRHYLEDFSPDIGFRLLAADRPEPTVLGEYRVLHLRPPAP
jgi:hypothetical protein